VRTNSRLSNKTAAVCAAQNRATQSKSSGPIAACHPIKERASRIEHGVPGIASRVILRAHNLGLIERDDDFVVCRRSDPR
jgi:hypothetical protein